MIRDSEFLLSGPFAQAALTSFFFMAGLNCFILLPLYVHRLGGTEGEIGIVQGAYSAIGILCQPVVGLWLDRVGRRAFMILGVVLLVVASACFIVTQSLPLLALLRVLQGADQVIHPRADETVALGDHVDRLVIDKGGVVDQIDAGAYRHLAALGAAGMDAAEALADLSFADLVLLAPIAGEIVVNNLGFRWLFLLAVLLSSVAALLVARTRGIQPPDMGAGPGLEMFRDGLEDVLRLHMALAFFFGLGTGAMFTFMPTFGESLGVRSVALYYTAYAVAAMVVRVAGGNLIDVRGRRATIIPSMFIQAASVAILAIIASLVRPHMAVPIVPFLILAGLLAGGGHGFLYPALSALLMDVTPERRRGGAVGIFSGVMLVGQTLGSMIFGYVAHAFGYAVMWGVVTFLLSAGFLLSQRLRERRAASAPVAG